MTVCRGRNRSIVLFVVGGSLLCCFDLTLFTSVETCGHVRSTPFPPTTTRYLDTRVGVALVGTPSVHPLAQATLPFFDQHGGASNSSDYSPSGGRLSIVGNNTKVLIYVPALRRRLKRADGVDLPRSPAMVEVNHL